MGWKSGDTNNQAPRGDPFRYIGLDDFLRAWGDTWVAGFADEAAREAHVRALFRYGLEGEERNGGPKDYYYSFCRRGWLKSSCAWHCRDCGECKEWRDWHCERCGECAFGSHIPCDGCGGVSERYEASSDYGSE